MARTVKRERPLKNGHRGLTVYLREAQWTALLAVQDRAACDGPPPSIGSLIRDAVDVQYVAKAAKGVA